MNIPAHHTRAIALAIGVVMAVPTAFGPDRLDPYRELTRGPARAWLLQVARQAAQAGEDSASMSAAASDPIPRTFNFELPPAPAALYMILQRGETTRACVAHEPAHSADLGAAVRALAGELRSGDRRRSPVGADELDGMRLVIGFAGLAEPVARATEIDPGREGLLIATDQGRIAFLPGEARTVAWALREARRVGVLSGPLSDAHFFRFDVVTMSDESPESARERKIERERHGRR